MRIIKPKEILYNLIKDLHRKMQYYVELNLPKTLVESKKDIAIALKMAYFIRRND